MDSPMVNLHPAAAINCFCPPWYCLRTAPIPCPEKSGETMKGSLSLVRIGYALIGFLLKASLSWVNATWRVSVHVIVFSFLRVFISTVREANFGIKDR